MKKEESERKRWKREREKDGNEREKDPIHRRHQMKLHRPQANDQEATLFTCPAQPNSKRKS
jgi:hypothetical protein